MSIVVDLPVMSTPAGAISPQALSRLRYRRLVRGRSRRFLACKACKASLERLYIRHIFYHRPRHGAGRPQCCLAHQCWRHHQRPERDRLDQYK
jgi:hypothetical protein